MEEASEIRAEAGAPGRSSWRGWVGLLVLNGLACTSAFPSALEDQRDGAEMSIDGASDPTPDSGRDGGPFDGAALDARRDVPLDAMGRDQGGPDLGGADLGGEDGDGDGVADDRDNCPAIANPDQADGDGDGDGDLCDPCPAGGDLADGDGDGAPRCVDCDDEDPSRFPAAIETCDGVDNNCDGQIDERFPRLGEACEAGLGICRAEGVWACAADQRSVGCDAQPGDPAEEVCNDRDDDCDGETDEGIAACCTPGQTQPCGSDVGACKVGTQRCDASGSWLGCAGDLGPAIERCNGVDDNCDGVTDEGFGLGLPCEVGLGVCLAVGQRECGADGETTCTAEPGLPAAETCDGVDEDCDGVIDNDAAGIGSPCVVGRGACQRPGFIECRDARLGCSVTPGEPAAEVCNGLDDDCDGAVDNDPEQVGNECVAGFGICRAQGTIACRGGALACDGPVSEPGIELRCNGLDDDCDGQVDEGFGVGTLCAAGQGVCRSDGVLACAGDGAPPICDALPGPPGPELCNGLDDDCDGVVDEDRVCGLWIEIHCQAWLVWADNERAGPGPLDEWGNCPRDARDNEGELRCTSTQGRGRFWDLQIDGTMDGNDRLGVRFTCEDPLQADLASWIESRCALFLGWADRNAGRHGDAEWAGCPAAPEGEVGDRRCVSSGGDGRFHSLRTAGQVNRDDDLAVAFICQDVAEPERAQSAAESVAFFLGWDADGRPVRAPGNVWDRCPRLMRDNSGNERCVGSAYDQLFNQLDIATGSVTTGASFGVALRAR